MEKVQLKNICRPKQWKTLTGKNLVPDGKYPVYGANGIIGYYNDYNHENETLMIGCRGTCGALNISQPFSYINGNAMALDDLVDDIDIRYLYYALMGRGFQDVISGAVQPQIIRADLEKMEVWIGNKKEQKEIVDVFSKLDTVLSHRKREIQYLDDLIKARFVEMFGDPVYSAIDSKIELSDICEKITDGEHGSVARVANGHPFLNAKHILKTGFIDWKTITYIGDEDHQRIYKRCNPEKGDILLTTTGTIGNVAIMPECEEVSMDRGITLLKINRHKVTSEFVAEMLKHPSIQMAMGANVHASAIGHLFMNKVKKLPAILPSMKKQIEFTTFVQQIDKSKLLSGCRLFHSWAPENRDKPKHVGVPRRRTNDLRGGRRQQ